MKKLLIAFLLLSFSPVAQASGEKVFTLAVTIWPGTSLEKKIRCIVEDGNFVVGGKTYLTSISGTVAGWKLLTNSIRSDLASEISDIFSSSLNPIPGTGKPGALVVKTYRVVGTQPDGSPEYEEVILVDQEQMLKNKSNFTDEVITQLNALCMKI